MTLAERFSDLVVRGNKTLLCATPPERIMTYAELDRLAGKRRGAEGHALAIAQGKRRDVEDATIARYAAVFGAASLGYLRGKGAPPSGRAIAQGIREARARLAGAS